MDWHNSSCRRLDLVPTGGVNSCLSCGSFEGHVPQGSAPSADTNISRVSRKDVSGDVSHHAPIHQKSEIRIFVLQPGEFEEPICGDLVVAELPSQEPYAALSYTWSDESGNAELCKPIQLNGCPFLVTANCELALRRIRRRSIARPVWIDAICIDQNNTVERGHQVELMPKIYSGAQLVLIYVGEAADGSDELLSAVCSGGKSLGAPRAKRFLDPLSVKSFFQRRYFQRIWVLQEVALARRTELICGTSNIPWASFKSGIASWTPTIRFQPPVLQFSHDSYMDSDQIVKMLSLAAKCQCQDPRDKVFSLLGLFPHTAGQAITPDYSLSVEEVYTVMALHIASEFSWNLLFTLASVHHATPWNEGWPVWVPDWRPIVTQSVDPSMFSMGRFNLKKMVKVEQLPMLNPNLTIELRVLKLPEFGFDKGSMSLSLLSATYFLPEVSDSPLTTRFVAFARDSYLSRWFQQDDRFSEIDWFLRSRAVFTNLTTIYPTRWLPRIAADGTTDKDGTVRIGKQMRGYRPKEVEFVCIPITDLLRYLQDNDSPWDHLFGCINEWGSKVPDLWSRHPVTLGLEELQEIAVKFPRVDVKAEALWAVPSWNHLRNLKQKWIPGELSAPDLPGLLRMASTISPTEDDNADYLLPELQPVDDDPQGNLGWGNHPRKIDLLVGEYWILEKKRALAWKILLRLFLPVEVTAVI
ncbi:HET-domain-containing protein [Apiospora arundinis]